MKVHFFLALTLLGLSVYSCAPKKKGKVGKVQKAYHNVTGKYNGFYNADLLMDEAYASLNQQNPDNYNRLLPIYPYAEASNAASVSESLDKAIQKLAKVIILHEPGNWTDNGYYRIGQCEFMLQEYEKAAATFQYVVTMYNPDKPYTLLTREEKRELREKEAEERRKRMRQRKRGKKITATQPKEVLPDSLVKREKYGLKHRPIRYQSMVWLARCYTKLGKYTDATLFFRKVEEDPKAPESVLGLAKIAHADYHIQREEYAEAIPYLEEGITYTKGRKNKSRLYYILAQLYQMQDMHARAMTYFEEAAQKTVDFEMEFNAKLNMAKHAAQTTAGKEMSPERALQRMLRDGKNEEYKDQIYFALAEIALRKGEQEQGIALLQASLNASQGNASQRAEAYLLLADLFYAKPEYIEASSYYDSTIAFLDTLDLRYPQAQQRQQLLAPIAAQIRVITVQDSLLTLASADTDTQKAWAQRLRKAEQLAAANKKSNKPQSLNMVRAVGRAGGNNPAPIQRGANARINQSDIQKSKFALYNPNTVKKGKRDFQKRWGNRAWADNWRTQGSDGFDQGITASRKKALPPMTNDEVAKMLEKHKIPLGASAKTTANDTIQGAYLRLAQLYRERLSLYEKAIHAGETLLKRYPETTRKMRAYFALYQAHRDAGNSAQAEVYKQKILSEFGDSQIAKVLKNPDFANEKKVQDFIINQYYDDTYLAVQRGNFAQAKKMLDDVPTRFGQENSHRARFALLEAMTQGGLEGKNAYIKALNTIITSFPNTDEQDKAKRMLAAISDVKNNETTSTTEPQKTGDNENPAPFTLRLDLPHYVIVVFEQDAKLSPLKANITDYNAKYHAVKRLRVSTILLGLEYPALIVRRFRDGSKALEYLVEIQNNPDFLEGHNARYKLYTISQDNYKTVLTKRNFMFYDAFYKENYPQ